MQHTNKNHDDKCGLVTVSMPVDNEQTNIVVMICMHCIMHVCVRRPSTLPPAYRGSDNDGSIAISYAIMSCLCSYDDIRAHDLKANAITGFA